MSTSTTLTCEVCGKELTYSGRGRPPKRCDEHKASPKKATTEEKPAARPRPRPAEAQPEAAAPRARPRPKPAATEPAEPAAESAAEAPAAPRPRPGAVLPQPAGIPDTKSRAKAEQAHSTTQRNLESVDSESWPRGSAGRPMAKVTFTASELLPTGQYANISVGPAQVTAFVDLDREGNGSYFTEAEKTTLTQALNELAEVIERDVVSVQRSIVLESIQEQLTAEQASK